MSTEQDTKKEAKMDEATLLQWKLRFAFDGAANTYLNFINNAEVIYQESLKIACEKHELDLEKELAKRLADEHSLLYFCQKARSKADMVHDVADIENKIKIFEDATKAMYDVSRLAERLNYYYLVKKELPGF